MSASVALGDDATNGENAQTATSPAGIPTRRRRSAAFVLTMVGLAVTVVGVAIVCAGLVPMVTRYQGVRDNSTSMTATLRPGQNLIVRRGELPTIRRGDIVLFRSPWPGSTDGGLLIKRVVGLGGDAVQCCDSQNRLIVNGHGIDEEYVNLHGPHPEIRTYQFSVTVPANSVFLLGDNRGDSLDSRGFLMTPSHGAVPVTAIQGRVVAAYTILTHGPVPITEAFQDAGLGDPPLGDVGFWNYSMISLIGGAGVLIAFLGVLILSIAATMAIVVRIRRARRRRPVVTTVP